MAIRTLWHEVLEARGAEVKANGTETRENWTAYDPSWGVQLVDLVDDVIASGTPDGPDPRAARIDLMAHLAAHVTAMDSPPEQRAST